MDKQTEVTEKINKVSKNDKSMAMALLPWGLFVVAVVVILFQSLGSKDGALKLSNVCDSDLTSRFSKVRRESFVDSEKAAPEYKALFEEINQRGGYKDDPTCVYMRIKYFYDQRDYDKAYFEVDDLEKLYNANKVVDSRHLSTDSVEQMRSDITYFKALQIETGGLQDDSESMDYDQD